MDEFVGVSGEMGGIRLRIADPELLDIMARECALCGDPMGLRGHVSDFQVGGKVLAIHMDCFDVLEETINREFPGRANGRDVGKRVGKGGSK